MVLKLSDDEYIDRLKSELSMSRRIAAYLASCHAATAEGYVGLKSVSRSKKDRHVSICRKAAAFLRGTDFPPHHYARTEDQEIQSAIERCTEVANKLAY